MKEKELLMWVYHNSRDRTVRNKLRDELDIKDESDMEAVPAMSAGPEDVMEKVNLKAEPKNEKKKRGK